MLILLIICMYECLFWDLHVMFPFDDFSMGFLHVLNMAPSQLQPNDWALIQPFQALCLHTYVKATQSLFLHYFCCRSHKKVWWVSLLWIVAHPLFRMFTSSYKNFKIGYLLFLFYWWKCPCWYDEYLKEYLTDEELWDLAFLKSHSHNQPTLYHLFWPWQSRILCQGVFSKPYCWSKPHLGSLPPRVKQEQWWGQLSKSLGLSIEGNENCVTLFKF